MAFKIMIHVDFVVRSFVQCGLAFMVGYRQFIFVVDTCTLVIHKFISREGVDIGFLLFFVNSIELT